MKKYLSLCFFLVLMCAALPLAACDEQGAETAAVEEGEMLPEAVAETIQGGVTDASSMDEDSPAGEGVTAEEIPHSDVPPPSREVFTDSECDFEGWVGQPVDEAAIEAEGRPFRILTPDSMMTMDHNPDRINVVHDADGKVTRVWCG